MKFLDPREFTGKQAWDALPVAEMNGITVRLHWTDEPYHWHVNDGEEVFVVLDGNVTMHYRDGQQECLRRMAAGDIFHAGAGTEHRAEPIGIARILVVEKAGSE